MKRNTKAQMGIREIIYFILGLLVLLIGYVIFGHSTGIIDGMGEVNSSVIPGLVNWLIISF